MQRIFPVICFCQWSSENETTQRATTSLDHSGEERWVNGASTFDNPAANGRVPAIAMLGVSTPTEMLGVSFCSIGDGVSHIEAMKGNGSVQVDQLQA